MFVKIKKILIIAGAISILTFFEVALAQTQIALWICGTDEKTLESFQSIAERWQEKNPDIKIEILSVEEATLMERAMTALATNSLPDMIYHPLEFSVRLAEKDVFSSDIATEIIEKMGKETFSEGALKIVKYREKFAALPVDGWSMLLVWRKDLIENGGFPPPQSWEEIEKIATSLHRPPLLWGIEVPTSFEHEYTQQVVETLSLQRGVRLVDQNGSVNLNTPEFADTLRFYKKLSKFTPPGNIYEFHTKMDYLGGRCVMSFFPSSILTELCQPSQKYPSLQDIYKKTGFTALINSPGSSQYFGGNYIGITTKVRDKNLIERFVEFLLNDEYLFWLASRPQIMLPLRKGNRENLQKFVLEWQ
ncbi:extracellular solute-binding protein, partial [Candidatus Aerophobetes bacterium]|nr:extracellular solute-binding protein [Candidatus Aerophobetes bacterium]